MNNIENLKLSIDRLSKVVIYKFESYDPEIAIDIYNDILQYYKSTDNDEFNKYIKYKLDWLNQHSKVDNYYRERIVDMYNKKITQKN